MKPGKSLFDELIFRLNDREERRGGQGVVKIATFRGREVAVKEIITQDNLHQIECEIRSLNTLKHVHIMEYIAHLIQKEKVYLITEFCERGHLGKVIHGLSWRYSISNVLDWASQICMALIYLKEKKVLHRDIKPQNILLSTDFQIKICDFGLSRKEETITLEHITGTYRYAPPEYVGNESQKITYNYKSDLYSSGLVMWETVERRKVFSMYNEMQMIAHLWTGDIRIVKPQCQEKLAELIYRCTDPQPTRRPETEEVLNELKQLMSEGFYQRYKQVPREAEPAVPFTFGANEEIVPIGSNNNSLRDWTVVEEEENEKTMTNGIDWMGLVEKITGKNTEKEASSVNHNYVDWTIVPKKILNVTTPTMNVEKTEEKVPPILPQGEKVTPSAKTEETNIEIPIGSNNSSLNEWILCEEEEKTITTANGSMVDKNGGETQHSDTKDKNDSKPIIPEKVADPKQLSKDSEQKEGTLATPSPVSVTQPVVKPEVTVPTPTAIAAPIPKTSSPQPSQPTQPSQPQTPHQPKGNVRSFVNLFNNMAGPSSGNGMKRAQSYGSLLQVSDATPTPMRPQLPKKKSTGTPRERPMSMVVMHNVVEYPTTSTKPKISPPTTKMMGPVERKVSKALPSEPASTSAIPSTEKSTAEIRFKKAGIPTSTRVPTIPEHQYPGSSNEGNIRQFRKKSEERPVFPDRLLTTKVPAIPEHQPASSTPEDTPVVVRFRQKPEDKVKTAIANVTSPNGIYIDNSDLFKRNDVRIIQLADTNRVTHLFDSGVPEDPDKVRKSQAVEWYEEETRYKPNIEELFTDVKMETPTQLQATVRPFHYTAFLSISDTTWKEKSSENYQILEDFVKNLSFSQTKDTLSMLYDEKHMSRTAWLAFACLMNSVSIDLIYLRYADASVRAVIRSYSQQHGRNVLDTIEKNARIYLKLLYNCIQKEANISYYCIARRFFLIDLSLMFPGQFYRVLTAPTLEHQRVQWMSEIISIADELEENHKQALYDEVFNQRDPSLEERNFFRIVTE